MKDGFDVIFDIDGTLSDPTHRLKFIEDMSFWVSVDGKLPKPDWKSFLSPAQTNLDPPIPQAWIILQGLIQSNCRIVFITGRTESTRLDTWLWLTNPGCPVRKQSCHSMNTREASTRARHRLLMRPDGLRTRSEDLKQDLLLKARALGYDPKLAFDDRSSDVTMYRANGIMTYQVAEGKF